MAIRLITTSPASAVGDTSADASSSTGGSFVDTTVSVTVASVVFTGSASSDTCTVSVNVPVRPAGSATVISPVSELMANTPPSSPAVIAYVSMSPSASVASRSITGSPASASSGTSASASSNTGAEFCCVIVTVAVSLNSPSVTLTVSIDIAGTAAASATVISPVDASIANAPASLPAVIEYVSVSSPSGSEASRSTTVSPSIALGETTTLTASSVTGSLTSASVSVTVAVSVSTPVSPIPLISRPVPASVEPSTSARGAPAKTESPMIARLLPSRRPVVSLSKRPTRVTLSASRRNRLTRPPSDVSGLPTAIRSPDRATARPNMLPVSGESDSICCTSEYVPSVPRSNSDAVPAATCPPAVPSVAPTRTASPSTATEKPNWMNDSLPEPPDNMSDSVNCPAASAS